MGKDIHMFIVDNKKEVIESDIFPGRNSIWFANLKNEGGYKEYNYLPIVLGWPKIVVPQTLKEKFSKEDGYFDFYHVKVEYFKEWFLKYRPNIDAGWATTYEAWAIKNKGYNPGYLPKELDEDANLHDSTFIEYKRCDDCSEWLYNYLVENNIDKDAFIVYCFDC